MKNLIRGHIYQYVFGRRYRSLCFHAADSEYGRGSVSFRRNEKHRRTRDRKEKILSLHRLYNIRCIFIGHADQRHRHGRSCIQQIWYGDSSLSRLLCAFHRSTHSFCDGTHQFCAYHDDSHQKCNCRRSVWTCDSQYPTNCRDGSWLFESEP